MGIDMGDGTYVTRDPYTGDVVVIRDNGPGWSEHFDRFRRRLEQSEAESNKTLPDTTPEDQKQPE